MITRDGKSLEKWHAIGMCARCACQWCSRVYRRFNDNLFVSHAKSAAFLCDTSRKLLLTAIFHFHWKTNLSRRRQHYCMETHLHLRERKYIVCRWTHTNTIPTLISSSSFFFKSHDCAYFNNCYMIRLCSKRFFRYFCSFSAFPCLNELFNLYLRFFVFLLHFFFIKCGNCLRASISDATTNFNH